MDRDGPLRTKWRLLSRMKERHQSIEIHPGCAKDILHLAIYWPQVGSQTQSWSFLVWLPSRLCKPGIAQVIRFFLRSLHHVVYLCPEVFSASGQMVVLINFSIAQFIIFMECLLYRSLFTQRHLVTGIKGLLELLLADFHSLFFIYPASHSAEETGEFWEELSFTSKCMLTCGCYFAALYYLIRIFRIKWLLPWLNWMVDSVHKCFIHLFWTRNWSQFLASPLVVVS